MSSSFVRALVLVLMTLLGFGASALGVAISCGHKTVCIISSIVGVLIIIAMAIFGICH